MSETGRAKRIDGARRADGLTQDEVSGLFRSRRGDDPGKDRVRDLERSFRSEERKFTTAFARSVSETEGRVGVRLKREEFP